MGGDPLERSLMKIEFTVWQFVRVMVYLENKPKAGAVEGEPGLLNGWQDIWTPLDQELAILSQDDFSAYANMMMDQNVVVQDVSAAAALVTKGVLESIAAEMDREIKKHSANAKDGDAKDSDTIENLQFEKSELLRSAAVIQSEL